MTGPKIVISDFFSVGLWINKYQGTPCFPKPSDFFQPESPLFCAERLAVLGNDYSYYDLITWITGYFDKLQFESCVEFNSQLQIFGFLRRRLSCTCKVSDISEAGENPFKIAQHFV